MNDDEIIRTLRRAEEHLSGYLEDIRAMQETLPEVYANLEYIRWQRRALSHTPPGFVTPDLAATVDYAYQQIVGALPRPQLPNVPLLWQTFAINASGTASISGSIYQEMMQARKSGSPAPGSAFDSVLREHQKLQDSLEMPTKTRMLLLTLGHRQAIDRFDRAYKAVIAWKAGTGTITTATNETRILLDGVKGVLFERARQHDKENMTWSRMANRLARGGVGGREHRELLKLDEIYSRLYGCLSNLAKDRKGLDISDPAGLWAQVIDFIQAILGFVDLSRSAASASATKSDISDPEAGE